MAYYGKKRKTAQAATCTETHKNTLNINNCIVLQNNSEAKECVKNGI